MGVQASLHPKLVPFGATTLLFVISASCAIFLVVGQAVFQARLINNLAQVVPTEVATNILTFGATTIRSNPEVQDLSLVLQAYSSAITQVLVRIRQSTYDTNQLTNISLFAWQQPLFLSSW